MILKAKSQRQYQYVTIQRHMAGWNSKAKSFVILLNEHTTLFFSGYNWGRILKMLDYVQKTTSDKQLKNWGCLDSRTQSQPSCLLPKEREKLAYGKYFQDACVVQKKQSKEWQYRDLDFSQCKNVKQQTSSKKKMLLEINHEVGK
jgi:hypothetical protein